MEVVPLDDRSSFAWLSFPDEPYERASVALAVEGGALLVDPVDAPGLDDALSPLGPVVGVATLFQRHRRDAEPIAARYGAPRLLPRALGGAGIGIREAEERTVASRPGWHEAVLWLPARRLLVCTELLGTNAFFLLSDADPLGLHPLGRILAPADSLRGLEPATIAVGHGRPVTADAAEALERALAGKLRNLPKAWLRIVRLARSR